MEDVNILNIPAYQRKRSISARARKSPQLKISRTRKRPERVTSKLKFSDPFSALSDIPVREVSREEEFIPAMETFSSAPEPEYREMQICGTCEGYFDKIDVAVVQLTSALRTDDFIIFETSEGLFEQKVTSMQINRKDVSLARSGRDIGLKVMLKPKVGGSVYKVIS